METDRLKDYPQERNTKAATPDSGANACGTASVMHYDPTAFLNDLFAYHSPRPDQLPKYQAIRSAAKHLAEVIVTNSRSCGDQERAITLLRQSVHMANAAVAMEGRF